MKKRPSGLVTFLLICCCLTFSMDDAFGGDKSSTETAGDILHIAIPALGLLGTFFAGSPDGKRWDKQGTYQLLKTVGFGAAVTYVGKNITDKERPNERSNTSYPSGHVSLAFSGAGFIDTRYGHKWGIPALAGAAFVGYSRVASESHYNDDVLAGASIGLISSWLFTTPQTQSGLSLLPMQTSDGAGLQLTMAIGGDSSGSNSKKAPKKKSRRVFRYNFQFGPAYLAKNVVSAPSDTGTSFDLNDFDKSGDPTATAMVSIEYFPDDRNEIAFSWIPFESSDTGVFSSPVLFDGKIFPANEQIVSNWRQNDMRLRWRYNLGLASPWEVKLGAGLFYQDTEIDLDTQFFGPSGSVRDRIIRPYGHGAFAYNITPKFSAHLEAGATYFSEYSMLDAEFFFNYQMSDRWDIALGYRYYSRKIDTDDLMNKTLYKIPFVTVSYSWLQ